MKTSAYLFIKKLRKYVFRICRIDIFDFRHRAQRSGLTDYFLAVSKEGFMGRDVRSEWEKHCFQKESYEILKAIQQGQSDPSDFFKMIKKWVAENPYGYGLHWVCPMVVAIRTSNWLLAFERLQSVRPVDENEKRELMRLVETCGTYIMQNLEVSIRKPPANHYLSDIAGLAFIGMLADGLNRANRWRTFALREIEKCIRHQVFEDGVYFENSISYHRYALEIYLYTAIWCRKRGIKLTPGYYLRLEKMIEFVMNYIRPDGKIPNFGDADDGIWFAFDKNTLVNRDDHRYLLALGAVLFRRGDFKAQGASASGVAEQVFGPDGQMIWEEIPILKKELNSSAFPEGGFYFMRSGGSYLAIIAGNKQRSPHQYHKHNDIFSFEICVGNSPFIIDSGTYTYTKDPQARNKFRSGSAHNIVVVDSIEPNALGKKGFFALPRDAQVEVRHWAASSTSDEFEGIIKYCLSPRETIVQTRSISFDKVNLKWRINDHIDGQGTHCCAFYIHFHPEATVIVDGRRAKCFLRDQKLLITFDEPADVGLFQRDISFRFGQKMPAPCLAATAKGVLPARLGACIQII